MRSRYSAYALGGYGGYLKTWFPEKAKGLTAKRYPSQVGQVKLELIINGFKRVMMASGV